MRRIKCFISYARKDTDSDSIILFINELIKTLDCETEILYDEKLGLGQSFDRFMKEIFNVDFIILLLSPEYKLRAESRISTGVKTEFAYILNRYEEFIKDNESFPYIIPIIFAGTPEESCPFQIKDLNFGDFTKFVALKDKNGEAYIPDKVYKEHRNAFKQIAQTVMSRVTIKNVDKAIIAANDNDIKQRYNNLRKILFEETKHDQVKHNINKAQYEHIFVETHAYNKLQEQRSYIFIGRKGSGKSTLSDLLYNKKMNHYKDHIEILVNYMQMEQAFGLLYNSKIEKDIEILFTGPHKYFQYSWEVFIYICCIAIICQEYEKGKLLPEQEVHIKPLLNFLKNKFKIRSLTHHTFQKKNIFNSVLSSLNNYLEKAIEKSRNISEASFIYDLNTYADREEIIKSIIGNKALNSLNKIISLCNRKILLSFDGFDNEFQSFRKNTINNYKEIYEIRIKRYRYEVNLLRGFLNYVLKSKENFNYSPISNILDFCITVPHDRFREVIKEERDSYRYINKYYNIRWSGIELAIMLRKRLEYINNKEVNTKNNSQRHKLDGAIIDFFHDIPMTTIIKVGGREYSKHIFLEILRHTFWRPREILLYFIKIVLVIEEIKKNSITLGEFNVGYIISDMTAHIIDSEFISEYKDHCINLEEILSLFHGCYQIMSYKSVRELIQYTDFEFADSENDIKSDIEKIKFLYDIGFIGFEISEDIRRLHKLETRDIFCFNESMNLFDSLNKDELEDNNLSIHPIFCEKLHLKNTDNQRLVLDYTWEYLEYQEKYGIILD